VNTTPNVLSGLSRILLDCHPWYEVVHEGWSFFICLFLIKLCPCFQIFVYEYSCFSYWWTTFRRIMLR